MSQYNFIVVGGTYQDQLIDPTPVPENDQLWNYDMESSQWQRVHVKNQGGQQLGSGQAPTLGHDVVPWNLVHHSAFKVDA